MNAPTRLVYNDPTWLDTLAAWLLALLWILPLAYAVWTGFHAPEYSTRFTLLAPLTLDNFRRAWDAAPFARYEFRGKNVAFSLVLVQLMIMPDILVVENYKTMAQLGLIDTLLAIGLPYFASAFAIFLLRQTFMGIPKELDEAARVEGASAMQVLWRVYVPLARPVYTAFALVSVSFHWNNFLWPLIVTNSVNARPLTVGLQVFSSVDQGVDWSIITAATLMTSAPLLVGFLLFQRQFVQSFMRAGIK
jgi:sn-glycerol 3-phosphate transport system permease protein